MNKRVGAVVILAAAIIAGCGKGQNKAEASAKQEAPQPVEVRTAAAETRTIDKTISVTGSLQPDESVNMSFEVPGRISRVLVDFGQNVRQGQVLAELDRQELNLQVERAKASLAQALARIGLEPGQENVRPETTPAIRQAQAQMEDARSKFENAAKLVKTGDIAQERYTELEKQFRARQAAYEASRDDVRTQLANVQALQAEVKLAQKRLGDTQIRAPYNGAVTAKLVSEGQYVKDNTPVLTIVKSDPLRLRVEVPEAATAAVRPGSTLTFHTDAAPGITFSAVVRQLNPSLDAENRTLTAEARLSKPDPRLRPGMFVQVDLVLQKNNEIVVVPQQAVYNVAGLTKLFVIRNGKAVEVRINPGLRVENWVEVPRDQVNPGDAVAVSGLGQLVNGLAVRTTASRASAAAANAKSL
jgi:membrane fusion protein, multidrug efflux system